MRHLAFAIDHNAGNATYQKNLAACIAKTRDVEASFYPIPLLQRDIWELVPVVNRNLALTASARTAAALAAANREKKIDAAFIHSQSLAHFSNPFMHKVPTVISSDGTPANFDEFGEQIGHAVQGKFVEGVKRQWTRANLSAARMLLAFSEWVKRSYVNDYGADPSKVVVIPSGVDTDLWKPDPAKRPNDGKVRILFTGGFFERKGGPVLLKWARETKHKNFELHLVTKHEVPETPGVFPHYSMNANANELVTLAQTCDMFALPTKGDCFPFAAIEAHAAGLPAVISDVGAIKEIVADGETGFLVKPGDANAFCERMDALVADGPKRERMGAAARARAVERFDSRKNSQRVLDLMLQVANG